jgi:hypothetical protein
MPQARLAAHKDATKIRLVTIFTDFWGNITYCALLLRFSSANNGDPLRSVKYFQDSFFWVTKKIRVVTPRYSEASSSFALRTIGAIVAKNRTT